MKEGYCRASSWIDFASPLLLRQLTSEHASEEEAITKANDEVGIPNGRLGSTTFPFAADVSVDFLIPIAKIPSNPNAS